MTRGGNPSPPPSPHHYFHQTGNTSIHWLQTHTEVYHYTSKSWQSWLNASLLPNQYITSISSSSSLDRPSNTKLDLSVCKVFFISRQIKIQHTYKQCQLVLMNITVETKRNYGGKKLNGEKMLWCTSSVVWKKQTIRLQIWPVLLSKGNIKSSSHVTTQWKLE